MPLLFDLSDRVKLRVSGADSARYLNGQVTNDIGKATASRAIRAAMLNAKGRMNADIFVHRAGDEFVVDADASQQDDLLPRMERYVIADDVVIEDVTNDFALFHVIGGDIAETVASVRVLSAHRFGCDGTDIWAPAADREQLLQTLSATRELLAADDAERFRIERGVPRWGAELSDAIIPVEANLEAEAIDYAKGCYIGQEVISRMKMSGQTNKRLCGVVSTTAVPLSAGWRLFDLDNSAVEAGWITSAARSAVTRREIALAFIKRGHNAPGSVLLAASEAGGENGVKVEVVALPFIDDSREEH